MNLKQQLHEKLRSSPFLILALRTLCFVGLFLCLDRGIDGFLQRGLAKYYGFDSPAAILLTGHSHTVLGVDKKQLESGLGVPVAKFAVEGANVSDRLAMIDYFLSIQTGSVKVVVYDVDAHTFTDSGLSSSSFRLLFPFMENEKIRHYVFTNSISLGDYYVRRFIHSSRYGDLLISVAIRGYLGDWRNLKTGQVDIASLQSEIQSGRFRKIQIDDTVVSQFEKTLALIRSKGVLVVLAYIPTIDIFNRAEPDRHREVLERFKRYAAKDQGVVFLDYNKDYEGEHSFFFDHIHMNSIGQREVTRRLSKDLQTLLGTEIPGASSGARN